MHHLLGRDVAPAHLDVALVAALVVDHRLPVAVRTQVVRHARGRCSGSSVRDPRQGVVVEDASAVVDGAQVIVGVRVAHELEVIVPVLHLDRGHEVVLVGQGPPHVAERSEPSHQILQDALVDAARHVVEAPRAEVVGVEEDEVGLDAELLQVEDAALELLEIDGVQAVVVPLREGRLVVVVAHRHVPLAGEAALERVGLGLVVVVSVALGKDAHPHLVERRLFQRAQRLGLELGGLVVPDVAGRADAPVRACRPRRRSWWSRGPAPGPWLPADGAMHSNEPSCPSSSRTLLLVRKVHLPSMRGMKRTTERVVAVVESVDADLLEVDDLARVGELALQPDFGKRVPGAPCLEFRFETAPLFDLCVTELHSFVSLRLGTDTITNAG